MPTLDNIDLSDGYPAYVRWWRPVEPRGAVLYFHGIQSHGGWYEQSGSLLAEQGLTVLMPDRRGSGLNTEHRGHAESAGQCVADAADALDALLNETGRADAHVVGVSWGGKLAVALADAAREKVRSLTLVAPGIHPKLDLSTADKFRVAVAMINDRSRMFEIPLNAARFFTANPKRIKYVEADDLKLLRLTASFLLASRRLDRTVRRFGGSTWQGPIHLFLAGRDKIIDNDKTREWLRGLPLADRRITEYPEAEHTIEFEPDPSGFFNDLASWIVAHNGYSP
ncbi:MAG: alpha/beta fold hydrolase [Planctomycetota bacterium]